jgi:membrane-associated phospholipid phosphatase
VVPEGTVVPPRTLWAGVPAKLRRELGDKDHALILEYAQNYLDYVQSEHARETGLLSAEALLDGLVVEQGIKLITWRERPNVDGQHGRFFQSSAGVDSSFPSSHSVVAWATASAIASEYPSHWTQFFVYSAATGVSLTRVMGQQHFPSDVLVGSAAGWLIGHYVVQRHHRARQTR